MKSIYIIQMHTGTLPAIIIKYITSYRYSHVGISFDCNCTEIYSFGRKKLNNFLNGGFIKQKPTDDFFKKYTKTVCLISEINVTDEQFELLKNILNDIEKNKDIYKYDFLGLIIRALFHIQICFKYKYVCSHFVAEMLSKASIYDFGIKTCAVTPQYFEKLTGCEHIYQGSYPINYK